ncbi:uncharacterized protein LOC142587025 isoform X2 [Dermacentor variabilis]|uniref:uncharacterized protein LOC142587025 isoform X2 n=1 Tax=Dermacentor variabilis TaxID=34621 RepID=UPI003F5BBC3F
MRRLPGRIVSKGSGWRSYRDPRRCTRTTNGYVSMQLPPTTRINIPIFTSKKGVILIMCTDQAKTVVPLTDRHIGNHCNATLTRDGDSANYNATNVSCIDKPEAPADFVLRMWIDGDHKSTSCLKEMEKKSKEAGKNINECPLTGSSRGKKS